MTAPYMPPHLRAVRRVDCVPTRQQWYLIAPELQQCEKLPCGKIIGFQEKLNQTASRSYDIGVETWLRRGTISWGAFERLRRVKKASLEIGDASLRVVTGQERDEFEYLLPRKFRGRVSYSQDVDVPTRSAAQSGIECLPHELFVMIAQHLDGDSTTGLALSSRTLWCRVLGEHVMHAAQSSTAQQQQKMNLRQGGCETGIWHATALICTTSLLFDLPTSIVSLDSRLSEDETRWRNGKRWRDPFSSSKRFIPAARPSRAWIRNAISVWRHPDFAGGLRDEDQIEKLLEAFDGHTNGFTGTEALTYEVMRDHLACIMRGGVEYVKRAEQEEEVQNRMATDRDSGQRWVLKNLDTRDFVDLQIQQQQRILGESPVKPEPKTNKGKRRKGRRTTKESKKARHLRKLKHRQIQKEETQTSTDQQVARSMVLAIPEHPLLTLDFILITRITSSATPEGVKQAAADYRPSSGSSGPRENYLTFTATRSKKAAMSKVICGAWAGHRFEVITTEDFQEENDGSSPTNLSPWRDVTKEIIEECSVLKAELAA